MTSGGIEMNNAGRVIQVQLRASYGQERISPMNLTARTALKLTGRKTFFEADLTELAHLGFTIEWIAAQPDDATESSNA